MAKYPPKQNPMMSSLENTMRMYGYKKKHGELIK